MADAQYVIDIAADMGNVEQTEAQLDALVSTLTGAGKGADFFSEAITRTTNELTAAKAAASASASALAENQAEFDRLERSALQLAKAAERTSNKFGEFSSEALDAAWNAAAAKLELDSYVDTLRASETAAAAAAAEEGRLATQLKNVTRLSRHTDAALGAQAGNLGKVQGALGALGGPLGSLGNAVLGPQKAFAELSEVMGESHAKMLLVSVASAVVVAAVVAITAAVVAGTVAIAAWAVGLADAARNERLAAEATRVMNPALAELDGTVRSISIATGMHAEEVQALAGALKTAKVAAKDMPAALRAAALAETALGKGGAAQFTDRLAEGKITAEKLAEEFETKLGPIVAKQMRGLGAQSQKLEKNIGTLFGGLNIDPVLNAFEKVVNAFDETSAIGGTIKFLFETIFQPLINQAENAYTFIEAFVLGALIALTKMYIAIKPTIARVKELLGFDDDGLSTSLDFAAQAGEMVAKAFVAVAVAVGVMVAAVGGVMALIAAWTVTLFTVVDALAGVAFAIGELVWNGINKLAQFGADLIQVGFDLMLGLAKGIANGGTGVIDAILGAVGGAITAAKKLLGINSPSKLFEGFGVNVGEGYVQGVDSQADAAANAVSGMVEPPDMTPTENVMAAAGRSVGSASASGESAGAGSSGAGAMGGSFNVIGNTFVFNGVKDAEQSEQRFGELFTRLMRGDVAALGNAEAA